MQDEGKCNEVFLLQRALRASFPHGQLPRVLLTFGFCPTQNKSSLRRRHLSLPKRTRQQGQPGAPQHGLPCAEEEHEHTVPQPPSRSP